MSISDTLKRRAEERARRMNKPLRMIGVSLIRGKVGLGMIGRELTPLIIISQKAN